ncbi:MAG TPA: hypothetical protein VNS32_20710 [Flavisolibacter sp.]|nr:hypothetical protein [Flavisolibacter sp.]
MIQELSKHEKEELKRTTNINYLTDIAWQLSSTALWNHAEFSDTEKEEARKAIRQYLLSAKDFYQAYLIYCQRILMARQYILNHNMRLLVLPSRWLHPDNQQGFAGTLSWYQRLQEIRNALPLHKIELKAFAEALLEMKEEPTKANFLYWRSYFIEKKAPGLLHLFLATLANSFYCV